MTRTAIGLGPAAAAAVLLPLLFLGSCTTTLLWGAMTSGSDAAFIAVDDAALTTSPDGANTIAVRIAAPLPEACATQLPRAQKGQWLLADLSRHAAAVAEIARLSAEPGAHANFQVSLYDDGDILLDAEVRLRPESLSAVQLVPGLRADFENTLRVQAQGHVGAIVDEQHRNGVPLGAARLRWWRPRPVEPRHSLLTRVCGTPFTLIADVLAIPVVPLGFLYWRLYGDLGGRG